MADSTLDMTMLEQEHRAWLPRILATNEDLADRIQALGVSVDYDEDDDALFIYFGPPVEALTESVNGVVYIRVDPDTLKIYGVEVWGVRSLITEAAAGLRLWWHATEALTARPREQVPASPDRMVTAEQMPLPVVSERLADDIRELVGV
jgi:uncharacterized protein YuzE